MANPVDATQSDQDLNTNQSDSSSRPSIWEWILLAIITFAALFMRARLNDESLWIDELHTAWVVAEDASDIPARSAIGNQSPLYFVGVWLGVQMGGIQEWVLRGPSIVAGAALSPLLFFLVRSWTRSATCSLLAAALAAIDPTLLFYGSEARPYALMQLTVVGHLFAFGKLLFCKHRKAWAWEIIFLLLGVVAFYLHYTAALLFPAEAIASLFLFAVHREHVAIKWQRLLALAGALALAMTTAYFSLANIFARRNNWSIGFGEGEMVASLEMLGFHRYLIAPLALFAFVAFIASIKLRFQIPWKRFIPSAPLTLAISWFLCPLLIAWIVTVSDLVPLFYHRYLLVALPGGIVFVAVLCSAVPRRLRLLFSVILLITALVTGGLAENIYRYNRLLPPRNEDWRGAIAKINGSPENDLPVALYSQLIESTALEEHPGDEALRAYTLCAVTSAYLLDNGGYSDRKREFVSIPMSTEPKLRTTDITTIASAGGCWVIVRGDVETGVAVTYYLGLKLYKPTAPYGIAEQHSFGHVQLLRLQRLE